jgi:two-component system phosphate regulon response regulator PhoB
LPTSGGKILIVDDEAAIRQMVCLALSQAGYHCLEAADVSEARARILPDKPDLILIDSMPPGVSDEVKEILKLT